MNAPAPVPLPEEPRPVQGVKLAPAPPAASAPATTKIYLGERPMMLKTYQAFERAGRPLSPLELLEDISGVALPSRSEQWVRSQRANMIKLVQRLRDELIRQTGIEGWLRWDARAGRWDFGPYRLEVAL